MKIAVIGSGISGLSAAYFLSKKHKVDLFEKEDRFGGHSHTLDILTDNQSKKKIRADIGFIVFNKQTYPNLINFFDEIGVEIEKSNMSLSFLVKEKNLEYSGKGVRGVFSYKKNLFNISFLKMFYEIIKFYNKSSKLDNIDDVDREQYASVQFPVHKLKLYKRPREWWLAADSRRAVYYKNAGHIYQDRDKVVWVIQFADDDLWTAWGNVNKEGNVVIWNDGEKWEAAERLSYSNEACAQRGRMVRRLEGGGGGRTTRKKTIKHLKYMKKNKRKSTKKRRVAKKKSRRKRR